MFQIKVTQEKYKEINMTCDNATQLNEILSVVFNYSNATVTISKTSTDISVPMDEWKENENVK